MVVDAVNSVAIGDIGFAWEWLKDSLVDKILWKERALSRLR
jgi:hypothetical protein